MLWSANFVLDYQVTDTSTDFYAQTELLACRKYFCHQNNSTNQDITNINLYNDSRYMVI